MRRSHYNGITIIELLIVIVIIGILITLVSPAVQSSRERARMTECANNLRQVGIAFQLHQAAQKHLPSNGWGYLWVGDPDRGFGREQPGGWIFNILPFLEQGDIRRIAAGVPAGSLEKKAETARMLRTTVVGLNCPDRRDGVLLPCNDPFKPYNSDLVTETVRSDFAANGGDIYCDAKAGMTTGPESFEVASTEKWKQEYDRLARDCNGIVHPQSTVSFQDITDGTTYTYMVGEKYMNPEHYLDGRSEGDKRSLYMGANVEINRWADNKPLYDHGKTRNPSVWGGPHTNGFNMVFCDGSLRIVNYDIDLQTNKYLSNRRDGEVVDVSTLR